LPLIKSKVVGLDQNSQLIGLQGCLLSNVYVRLLVIEVNILFNSHSLLALFSYMLYP